jgi:two-component system CheB/CheR fusion protein
MTITIKQIESPDQLKGMVLIVLRRNERVDNHIYRNRKKQTTVIRDTERTWVWIAAIKEDLLNSREQMQASQEELKSINEELQSTNEELQSTNEELTTSKKRCKA